MSLDLNHQKVLITGSSQGLGRLLALALAKLGADIVVHGREAGDTTGVLAEVRTANPRGTHSSLVCDFNHPESIKDFFGDISELDILVNNAGIFAEGDTLNIDQERIMKIVNIDLTSHMVLTRQLLPVLVKSQFAQILNTVSIAGVEIPFDYFHTIYGAAKFGMQGFTEGLEKEYANKNLRVMGVYPGGMETNLFANAGIDYKDDKDWMFDPQETVEAMVFMLTRNQKIDIKRLDIINHLGK